MSAAENIQSPQLEAALFYASLGFSVVPVHRAIRQSDGVITCTCAQTTKCTSKGKHPAVNWIRYQQERPTDSQIIQWWTGYYSGYGVGIITGAVSNTFVVDIDAGPGKAGSDTIINLQTIYDDLPHTVEARTGGGGRHLLFRHPGTPVITGRNVLGPGVDVRGDGGFVVAAPSVHESGAPYLWHEHAHPRNAAIATAPAWLVDMVTGHTSAERSPTGLAASGEIVRDEWGKVIDGRERHMIGIICGVIATLKSETGHLPDAATVMAEAWPHYEQTTRARGASLEADGRGESLMAIRIGHFLRRAETGRWKLEDRRPFEREDDHDPETGEIPRDQTKPEQPRQSPRILSLSDLDQLPPPVWLIDGIVPHAGLVVPYGPPKAGKTFLILSMALHIAAGVPWMNRATRRGAVVYIAGEGVGGLSVRLRAMRQHYSIGIDIPMWVIPRAVNLRDEKAVRALADLIRQTIGDTPLALLVVDTLARAMPGADENSAQDVGLVIHAAEWLRDEFACTVMPIHHMGKDETRGARGTSALRGAWDAAFAITGDGKGAKLTIADLKDAEAGAVLQFKMERVAVGIASSSLVPVLADGPPPDADGGVPHAPSGLTGICLTLLREMTASPEATPITPFGIDGPGVMGIAVDRLRQEFYRSVTTREPEARRKAFQRAVETLVARGLAGTRDAWIWCGRKEHEGNT